MLTSELTGAPLDYWVARAEKLEFVMRPDLTKPLPRPLTPAMEFAFDPEMAAHEHDAKAWKCYVYYQPSQNWAQGGPIIQRERIQILTAHGWMAKVNCLAGNYGEGETPLVAAMRAYVASKFGETVAEVES